jgi:D-alanine-D-alanine ligase
VLVYNAPALRPEHPDFASEAGVLDSVAALGNEMRSIGHRITELAAGSPVSALVGELEELRPDVVVNLCEGFAGCSAGEPHVAALLELLHVPYTGSPPECLALARDKPRTKRLLAGAGVMTPEFVELPRGQPLPEPMLRQWQKEGPLMVKPAYEDASLGIGPESVTVDWEALERQVAMVHERYGVVLIERFIAGREFNVGIVELPDLRVLPISEIEFRTGADLPWPIVTYAAKWSPDSKEDLSTPVCCPAAVQPILARRMETAAIAAYRLTGCRDYARIDLRVDNQGQVYVLEVNANPDIGPNVGLARMLQVAGIGYGEFGQRLLNVVRSRGTAARRTGKSEKTVTDGYLPGNSQASERLLDLNIRRFQPEDRIALVDIVRSCGVFRPEEIKIADEVLGDALRDGPAGDYHVLVAEAMGRSVGWSCHGRVPLTDATFDLYWIAVAPDVQGRGAGRQLLAEVECAVRAASGRWLLAETSTMADYHATRLFYERCGFRAVDQIDDFYRVGDGKITFGKRLE